MFNPVDNYKYVAPLELYLNGNILCNKYVAPPELYLHGNNFCYRYVAPLELYLDGNNWAINISPLWSFYKNVVYI